MNGLDPEIAVNLVVRSIHVVAGVMWLGTLWFLSFVNTELTKSFDASTNKTVLPKLMPRTLYWFRWAALFTAVAGIALLRNVVYMGGVLLPPESSVSMATANVIGMGTIFVAYLVYEGIWRLFRGAPKLGAAVFFVLIVGVAAGLAQVLSGRAALVHVGAMFGMTMTFNAWLRIWPNLRTVIAEAAKGEPLTEDALSIATERLGHNTYLSVPVLVLMISSHYPTVLYGLSDDRLGIPLVVAVVVGAGWLVAKLLFIKSAGKAPTRYERTRTALVSPWPTEETQSTGE